ncbi:MAG: FkbM family methyltransferase [Pseudomonadota bacterium]
MKEPPEASADESDALHEPSQRRVVRSFRGRRVVVHGDRDDPYFQRITHAVRRAQALENLLRQLPRKEGVALDVGANLGITSLAMARACEGPVYAVEPHRRTFAYLRQTLKANSADRVTAMNLALSDRTGPVQLFADNNLSASHLVHEKTLARTPTESAWATTIDALVADPQCPVAFIKIDAEGAEPAILSGAEHTLHRDRPSVFVEYNAFTLMAVMNVNPRDFLERLLATFPYVYRFQKRRAFIVRPGVEALSFLHDVLTQKRACDDLLGTFDPL